VSAIAPAASTGSAAPSPPARAPEYSLPVPPGSSQAQVEAGERLFNARTCTGCHGQGAKGTPLGPDLTAGKWIWSDGSLAGIRATIDKGVATPKTYRSPMPPKGGAQLSESELNEVAAYVWAVGHQGK
jgi:mono/diheme cytochrome c family protein